MFAVRLFVEIYEELDKVYFCENKTYFLFSSIRDSLISYDMTNIVAVVVVVVDDVVVGRGDGAGGAGDGGVFSRETGRFI